jgi:hypothetical protein
VNLSAIRERVKALQGEIAELKAANEEYLNKHIHSTLVVLEQREHALGCSKSWTNSPCSRERRLYEEALCEP